MRNLLFSLLLIPFGVSAQITLTENDFAGANDLAWMSTTTDFAIDFGTTGPNQTWDYSTLIAENQYLMDHIDAANASFLVGLVFGAFAPSEYQASYYMPNDDLPLSQVGGFLPVNISNVFQFSKKTSGAITSLGYAIDVEGTEVPFKSDTIETRYELPLNYTDTYSSRGYTNMDLNPILDAIWRQYRQRFSEVDGWGSITTPYGTFDALRVKHTITEVDSIYFDLLGTGSPMWIPLSLPDTYIYEWWTNNQKEAILRIETTDLLGSEQVTSVEFRDQYLMLETSQLEENASLKVYPNPAEDQLRIEGLNSDSKYSIIDMNGRLVFAGKIGFEIDIASLKPGSYQIIFDNLKGISPLSFIKK